MKSLREQFEAAGAALVPDGDALRIEAPGPLAPALLARIRERRDAMLERYHERSVCLMLDEGMTREAADAIAASEALDTLDTPAALPVVLARPKAAFTATEPATPPEPEDAELAALIAAEGRILMEF